MTTPGGGPPDPEAGAPNAPARPEQDHTGPDTTGQDPATPAPEAAETPPEPPQWAAPGAPPAPWGAPAGGQQPWGPPPSPWAPPGAQAGPYPAQPQWGAVQPQPQDWSVPQYPGQQYPPTQQYPAPPTGQWGAPAWGQPTGQAPTGQWGAPAWGQPTGQHPAWGPPPSRSRGKLVALITIGAVVLAGLGVGTFLLLRGSAGTPSDFQAVRTSYLQYAVPPDWKTAPAGQPQRALGVQFDGVADGPEYQCEGSGYLRGTVASALVTLPGTPEQVARAFASTLGVRYYTAARPPDVTLSAPRSMTVDGVTGALVEATSRTAADDGCLATEGTVLVLALPTTGPDGRAATALLVVNGDVAGGPATPPSPNRQVLDQIIGSARLPGV